MPRRNNGSAKPQGADARTVEQVNVARALANLSPFERGWLSALLADHFAGEPLDWIHTLTAQAIGKAHVERRRLIRGHSLRTLCKSCRGEVRAGQHWYKHGTPYRLTLNERGLYDCEEISPTEARTLQAPQKVPDPAVDSGDHGASTRE